MMKIGNVLSLFDGISCGQVALNRAGVEYEEYYASEIEKSSIECTQKNYPLTLQLGDVTKIEGGDLPKIDLLMGGSPCQGFSRAGKGLNFEDPRSKLFFDFLRIYEETLPRWFLLENVKMKKESQDIISKYLGVEPVEINSSIFSAQNRKRLYWTNIKIKPAKDLGIVCDDIIDAENEALNGESWLKWWSVNEKTRTKKGFSAVINGRPKSLTLTARHVANWGGNLVKHSGGLRFISVLEAERLQTLPEGYTKFISEKDAYRAIGNGWTVEVIAHILKSIKPNG